MNTKTTLSLHAGMGQEVLARLGQFVDINQVCSRSGVIAGQAVASAVSEIFGDARAVAFNDVDVFRVMRKEDQKTTVNTVLTMEKLSEFHLFDDYQQIRPHYEFHYRVAQTHREDMLNEIRCFGKSCFLAGGQESVRKFLDSFDLNCVQVGIDIDTKSLVWTKQFETFMQTRQLLVSSVKTPVHTAIRWFRKLRELDGVYGQTEYAMDLLGAAIQRATPSRCEVPRHDWPEARATIMSDRLKFSTNYLDKMADVQGDVRAWFNVEQQPNEHIDLYTLTPRFAPSKPLMEYQGLSDFFPLYAQATHGHWRDHICQNIKEIIMQPSEMITKQHLHLHGVDELLVQLSRRKLAKVNNIIKHHRIHKWYLSRPLADQLEFIELISKMANKFGLWIYGVMENEGRNNSECNIEKIKDIALDQLETWFTNFFENEFKRLSSLKSIKPLLPEIHLPSGYVVRELTGAIELANEGARLHHCVLGYFEQVSRGNARILSLFKPKASESLTIELHNTKSAWSVAQARGVCNRETTPEEKIVVKQAQALLTIAQITKSLPKAIQNHLFERIVKSAKFERIVTLIVWKLIGMEQSIDEYANIFCKRKIIRFIDRVIYGSTFSGTRLSLHAMFMRTKGNSYLGFGSHWNEYAHEWLFLMKLRASGFNPSTWRENHIEISQRLNLQKLNIGYGGAAYGYIGNFDEMDDDLPF